MNRKGADADNLGEQRVKSFRNVDRDGTSSGGEVMSMKDSSTKPSI